MARLLLIKRANNISFIMYVYSVPINNPDARGHVQFQHLTTINFIKKVIDDANKYRQSKNVFMKGSESGKSNLITFIRST